MAQNHRRRHLSLASLAVALAAAAGGLRSERDAGQPSVLARAAAGLRRWRPFARKDAAAYIYVWDRAVLFAPAGADVAALDPPTRRRLGDYDNDYKKPASQDSSKDCFRVAQRIRNTRNVNSRPSGSCTSIIRSGPSSSSLGHAATHEPLERNGALVPLQLMHSELAGPVHVPQEASHAAQTALLLAIRYGHERVVRQLASLGADVIAKSNL